jgi:hypothetical protein
MLVRRHRLRIEIEQQTLRIEQTFGPTASGPHQSHHTSADVLAPMDSVATDSVATDLVPTANKSANNSRDERQILPKEDAK